ncbi:hypothetical protein K3495_g10822 [Podosphaera aphanis]|nr:hypothetical protein K3495_g10822 [Podosphaera aphanis]
MSCITTSTDSTTLVLGSGVGRSQWITNLQSALVQKRCLGHVFHNIPLIKPAICPEEPRMTSENATKFKELYSEYEEAAVKWTEGEIVAKQIVVNMISKEICPQKFINMTAKQIFDHVSNVRVEGTTTPWETAVRNLLSTKFTSTANTYCNEFMQNYLDVNSAAESMSSTKPESSKDVHRNIFEVNPGFAGYMFILGTEGIEWLNTWRQTKVYDAENRYVSLDTMMSTLRQVAKVKEGQSAFGQVAVGQERGHSKGKGKEVVHSADSEAICTRCVHNKHKNKNCFKQHPELRKSFRRNGSAKAASGLKDKVGEGEDDDSDGQFDLGTIH